MSNSRAKGLMLSVLKYLGVKKGKSVPLQAWTGPEGPRKL